MTFASLTEPENFNVVHSDVYEPVSFKLSIVTDNIELYMLILLEMTLSQGERGSIIFSANYLTKLLIDLDWIWCAVDFLV